MQQGWIKLHRKLLDWEWYSDANTCRLFIHLLLKASHKDYSWRGIDFKRGSLITGRIKLAEELGISQQQIRTSLNKLKSTSEITIKTTNKYSVISLLNWDLHQQDNQQTTTRVTNKQPTSNHIQECKELKECKEDSSIKLAFGYWNTLAKEKGLSQAQVLNAKRKTGLKKRLKDAGGIDGWKVAVDKVVNSSFCLGDNKNGWKANLDFLLSESSFIKVMEGNYDGQSNKPKSNKQRQDIIDWVDGR